ncbi:MAG TPA: type IV pilus twitching motility protein PilT, partial [Myxococcota bacterium]|nr:type IV pilus twitching motility protein PilT [Myxococcota bacterium]
ILCEMGALTKPQLAQVLKARDQLIAKQKAMQAVAKADAEPEVRAAPAATVASAAAAPPARAAAPHASAVPNAAAAPRADAVPRRTSVSAPPRAAAAPADAKGLHELLRAGVSAGASDIHIHAGTPLRLRLHGQFKAANEDPIEPSVAERLVFSALTEDQAAALRERGELDFAYDVAGLGRFRVNIYRQQRGYDGVFRAIPAEIPTLEQLGLPASLARFTNFHQGMVLVTGPANCGKSSTLAALVNLVNEERREHILTVEDPVEFVHAPKRCAVNQRNVGAHTESFARALRAALREDPDVIVIGELRDLETISLALTAAETGHLVLATLHTNSSIRTINRLVGVFPADQQDQIRNMVSESLCAVISQRLVPAKDGGSRVPALEVLVNNKAVGNLIRENKTFQIFSILQMGSSQGMCLLDDSLNKLLASGAISKEEALRNADDPKRIKG